MGFIKLSTQSSRNFAGSCYRRSKIPAHRELSPADVTWLHIHFTFSGATRAGNWTDSNRHIIQRFHVTQPVMRAASHTRTPRYRPADTRVAIAGTDIQGGPVAGIYRPVSQTMKSVDRFLARRTVPQLVHKSPDVYGTRRFMTVLSTARHLFLSWAKRIQFTSPHPVALRSILKLHCHLLLSRVSGFFLPAYPNKTLYFSFLHPPHATTTSTTFILSPE